MTQKKAVLVPEYAVVRLGDGRAGVLAKRTSRKGKYTVAVNDGVSVEIKTNMLLEVLAYPAETARWWLAWRMTPADDRSGEDEACGYPPVFLKHKGITVYHVWHDNHLATNWYTTDPDDADLDHGGEAQFDVRDLPPAPPTGHAPRARADHRARLIAAIDAGLFDDDGRYHP